MWFRHVQLMSGLLTRHRVFFVPVQAHKDVPFRRSVEGVERTRDRCRHTVYFLPEVGGGFSYCCRCAGDLSSYCIFPQVLILLYMCRGRPLLEAQREQEDPRAYACGENLEGSRQSPMLVSMHYVHACSLYILSVYGLLGDFNAW